MKYNLGDRIFQNDVEIRGDLTINGVSLPAALDGYGADLAALNTEVDANWAELNTQTQSLRDAADGYGLDLLNLNTEVDSHWLDTIDQTQALRDAADGYIDADSYQDCFLGNVLVTSLENLVLTLTPTGTAVDLDAALSNSYIVDLGSATGTVELELSNFSPGMSVAVTYIQDVSSPQQILYPSYVLFEDSVSPVLSTGSLAVDSHVIYFTGQHYLCTVAKNFGAA